MVFMLRNFDKEIFCAKQAGIRPLHALRLLQLHDMAPSAGGLAIV